MISIYDVLDRACHSRCKSCYTGRSRPRVRGALREAVDESKAAFPKALGNLPDELRCRDRDAPSETAPGGDARRVHRILLAGGEVPVDPLREEVLACG